MKVCNHHRLQAFKAKTILRWPNQLIRQKGRVVSGRSYSLGTQMRTLELLCSLSEFCWPLGLSMWGPLLVVALRKLEPVEQLKTRRAYIWCNLGFVLTK